MTLANRGRKGRKRKNNMGWTPAPDESGNNYATARSNDTCSFVPSLPIMLLSTYNGPQIGEPIVDVNGDPVVWRSDGQEHCHIWCQLTHAAGEKNFGVNANGDFYLGGWYPHYPLGGGQVFPPPSIVETTLGGYKYHLNDGRLLNQIPNDMRSGWFGGCYSCPEASGILEPYQFEGLPAFYSECGFEHTCQV